MKLNRAPAPPIPTEPVTAAARLGGEHQVLMIQFLVLHQDRGGCVPDDETWLREQLAPMWAADRFGRILSDLKSWGAGKPPVIRSDQWGLHSPRARRILKDHWVTQARKLWGALRKYGCECYRKESRVEVPVPTTKTRAGCPRCGLDPWEAIGLPMLPWVIHEDYGPLLGGRASLDDPIPVDPWADSEDDDYELVDLPVYSRPTVVRHPSGRGSKLVRRKKKGKARASPARGHPLGAKRTAG